MKAKILLLVSVLAALAVPTLSSCAGQKIGGADTIQIRCYKGGYGDDWLHELASQFEKTFPGKKVEIVESSALVSETAMNEIQTPNKNQIDLYFTNGTDVSTLIHNSKKVLISNEEVLLEDLTDIYQSKAIGFDGKEEQKTIAERMFDGYKEAFEYHGHVQKWDGKMYKLCWADAMTGIIVNPAIFQKYNLDLPLTSNELINAVKTIASHTSTDKIFPYSWGGANSSGYWSYLFETWFAQYSGRENFNKFMKCENKDGNIHDYGYEVYQDIGIKKSLEAMFEILDLRYSSNGSASKAHNVAQNEFLRGESAFMVVGDWLLDEMKEDYFEEAKNMVMLKTPILSSIGTDNGLSEAQLHEVVSFIDQGKTDAEILASVNGTTASNVAKIRDARSIHDGIGVSHDIVIPSYCDAKETAKLFVRFLYSNDGCRVFRNKAYANLPLKYEIKEGDSNTNFQKSLDNIYASGKPQMVSSSIQLNDVRSLSQMYVFNVTEWQHPTTYKSIMLDKNSKNPVFSPSYIFENEAKYMEDNWSTYMELVL